MAFRFRRSVQLIPGLRVNLGKRGVSLSAGMRGANVTLGRGGLFANTGLPGTGLSVRSKIAGAETVSANSRKSSARGGGSLGVQLNLNDDGSVELTDDDGYALSAKHQRMVREQQSEKIRDWLCERCDCWNKSIDDMLNLHLQTPAPSQPVEFIPLAFDDDPPIRPAERSAGLIGLFSPKRKSAVEQENTIALRQYEAMLTEWENAKIEHEKREAHRRWLIEVGRRKTREGMEEYLESVLGDIDWPRETNVSFEVSSDARTVFLDVDLPEVEDMPTESATVAARGFKISVKKRTETQIRKEYMVHIHAIAFRVIGEAFAALPHVVRVVCSGYSQRPDPKTGHTRDDYLFSVSVDRERWSGLSFGNLDLIDHVACFEIFGMCRDVSKTGVFKPIEPISS